MDAAVEYLMTTKEVARVLRVSPITVDKMVRDGMLEYVTVRSLRRFTADQVRDYIRRASVKV